MCSCNLSGRQRWSRISIYKKRIFRFGLHLNRNGTYDNFCYSARGFVQKTLLKFQISVEFKWHSVSTNLGVDVDKMRHKVIIWIRIWNWDWSSNLSGCGCKYSNLLMYAELSIRSGTGRWQVSCRFAKCNGWQLGTYFSVWCHNRESIVCIERVSQWRKCYTKLLKSSIQLISANKLYGKGTGTFIQTSLNPDRARVVQ